MNVKSRIEKLETNSANEQHAQKFWGIAFQPDPDNGNRFEVRIDGVVRVVTADELRRLNPQKIIVGVSANSL